jgi:hypothetical protein
VALQNLHPRFKSGRRLQFPSQIRVACDAMHRVLTVVLTICCLTGVSVELRGGQASPHLRLRGTNRLKQDFALKRIPRRMSLAPRRTSP